MPRQTPENSQKRPVAALPPVLSPTGQVTEIVAYKPILAAIEKAGGKVKNHRLV